MASALALCAGGAGVYVSGAWFRESTTSTGIELPGGTLALGAFGQEIDGTLVVSNVKPMSEADALDPDNTYGAAVGEIRIDNSGTVAMAWEAEISDIESSLYLWPDTLYIAVEDETDGSWTAHDASDLFENSVPLPVGSGKDLDPATVQIVPIRVYLREDWQPPFGGWSEAWGPTFTISARAQQTIAP